MTLHVRVEIDRRAVMGVTGTCAQRSRWSRLRAFVVRASFVGGLAAGACLGAVATAAASPDDGAASAHRAGSAVPDIAAQVSEQVGDDVATDRPSPLSAPPTGTAPPAEPDEDDDLVAPVEPVPPAKPAKPQVEKPSPAEVDPPAELPSPASPFEEEPEEPAEAAVLPPPPPAPAAVPALEPSEPTRHANAEPTWSTSDARQRAEAPPAPAPDEPAAERAPGPPAPLQTSPAPTMAAVGSAPGWGSGPRHLAILPAAVHEPRPAALPAEQAETAPLNGIVSFEPSTSPD